MSSNHLEDCISMHRYQNGPSMWLKSKQANRDNSPAKLKGYTYKPDQPVDLTNNKLSPMRRADSLQHLDFANPIQKEQDDRLEH